MKHLVYLVSLITLLVLTAFFPLPVNAQYGQYGMYGVGGGPARTIVVDKLVGNPTIQTKGGEMQFIDNITVNDFKFKPGDQVLFTIKVKNTSTETLPGVTLKDVLPASVEPVEGPGDFNASNRTINVNVGDLKSNEEKTYRLKLQIAQQEQLPADKGLFCLVNRAEARSSDAFDDDTAQFCVEKAVPTTVSRQPAAGPEMGLILLGGQSLLLGLGYAIRKMTA